MNSFFKLLKTTHDQKAKHMQREQNNSKSLQKPTQQSQCEGTCAHLNTENQNFDHVLQGGRTLADQRSNHFQHLLLTG